MKTLVRIMLLLLPIIVLVVGTQAQQCSSQQTAGKYVVTCDGYLPKPGYDAAVPSKLLGTFTLDRSGNGSGAMTLNVLGDTLPATYNTYKNVPMQINPDCTGTAILEQKINGAKYFDLNLNMVVSQHGDVIDMLETDPGAIFSCKATRMLAVKNQPTGGIL